MNNELKSEQQIREFLLGKMSEDDRITFEESLLEDGDFFTRVRLVEEELLESYARGEMSANQRADFENAFLTTKIRREHVAFNKTLAEKLKSAPGESNAVMVDSPVGILASLKTLFSPQFAVAAFALLLVVFGVWVAATRFPNPAADLALNDSETKKDGDSATANRPQQPDSNVPRKTANSASVEPENVAANSPDRPPTVDDVTRTEKKTPTPPVKREDKPAKEVKSPVLALVAGRLRSDGAGNAVTFPENAKGLILKLQVKDTEFKTLSIELRNADDTIVYRRSGLLVRNGQASLLVPAEVLKKGDYAIELFGTSESAVRQSLSDYQFRVQ